MTSEKTTRPRFARLRRVAIFGLWGLIALGVCIGAVVLHSRAEKQRAGPEIEKRLDAIRAAGEPVTAEDLAKLYPDPPPEQDAILLLAPAVAAFREPDESNDAPFIGSGELPPRTQALTLQMRTNVEAILDDNQKALKAIPWDKITNAWIGQGFAPGPFGISGNNYSTHPARMLERMLFLKAVVEAESGNGTKSIESLIHSLELVHLFRSEELVYHLLRRTGEQLFCEVLERVFNRAEISTSDLAALEHLLSDDQPEGFGEALLSERCQNIWSMNLARTADNATLYVFNSSAAASESKWKRAVKSQVYGTFYRLSGKFYSDTDFPAMLDLRSAQIAALKLPPKERFAEFTQLNNKIAKEGRSTWVWTFVGATNDLSKLLRSDAEVLAKLQVTRAALAIERWRLAHGGRAPDSLADLVPEFASLIPLDPFDNHPLRYRKLARGFLVYSIGADFTDDGGKEKPRHAADTGHYDITFSVER